MSVIKYCKEQVFYTFMSAAGFIKAVTGKCLSEKRHGTLSTFFETKSRLGSRLDSFDFELPKDEELGVRLERLPAPVFSDQFVWED